MSFESKSILGRRYVFLYCRIWEPLCVKGTFLSLKQTASLDIKFRLHASYEKKLQQDFFYVEILLRHGEPSSRG
jgi:hypothetical protein